VVVVGQFKILSGIMITILCAVLVIQSTVVAISIQPVSTAAEATSTVATAMKLSTVAKMLVDNAIQEFQSNNINNTITHLQGAEQELLSSIAIVGNNHNNSSASVSTSMAQSLDSGDYVKGQKYLNLAEHELGRNILGFSSSLNPQTITSTFNATFNNSNDNYSFYSTYLSIYLVL